MLRLPEVEVDEDGRAKAYASGKDRVLVRRKMELVMRVFQAKGAKRVVLGAWGCGAYGNPVGEVAAAWREVLLGSKRGAKADAGAGWEGIEEIVFAIKDASLAERFAEAFGDGLVREQEEGDAAPENEEEEEDPETARVKALQDKTKETELSAEQAKSPQLICG
ncbi:e8d8f690-1346-4bd4-b49d-83b658955527 [Thermothielavioides terrestris]|nr:e8d8f690-1346-4bd4-b49d-83b658955527 [Thermothielavioides terrestris]